MWDKNMTVEEFYAAIGGGYNAIMRRLPSPDEVLRFVNLFLKDNNFNELKAALDDDNAENAFKAAHNLKGVSANLAFKELTASASDMTEALRNGDIDAAKRILPDIEEDYELIIKLSKELQ